MKTLKLTTMWILRSVFPNKYPGNGITGILGSGMTCALSNVTVERFRVPLDFGLSIACMI